MKINLISGLFIGITVMMCACKQTAKPAQTDEVKADSTKTTVAHVADTTNTADMFNTYIGLKNQFLKSNLNGIKSSAGMLANKLAGIKGCTETSALAQKIATSDDIKMQRDLFLTLSQDVIGLIKGTHFSEKPIYVDFCPMANGGKGGYWLSLAKDIQNPYFPEHMKTCGQVKETIN